MLSFNLKQRKFRFGNNKAESCYTTKATAFTLSYAYGLKISKVTNDSKRKYFAPKKHTFKAFNKHLKVKLTF